MGEIDARVCNAKNNLLFWHSDWGRFTRWRGKDIERDENLVWTDHVKYTTEQSWVVAWKDYILLVLSLILVKSKFAYANAFDL